MPFRQLALAARALGRGRFDLDLPTTRIPEARAIARALDSSAGQLRDRLEREREFGLLASHALRTTLTSLRLNLEEPVDDPEISDEARETAHGCLRTVGRIGEGDIELPFTPGPVEQALDLVLEEVVRGQRGGVRRVFEGLASTLTVDISCADGNGGMVATAAPVQEHIGAVLAALGGRIEEPAGGTVLRVLLPRR